MKIINYHSSTLEPPSTNKDPVKFLTHCNNCANKYDNTILGLALFSNECSKYKINASLIK